uniref:G-protein coupled receptors family 1 profile domain-containing protein n=1 Tax=Romanomermis culicivorax TaxID=13658 RepID=A0A915L0R0_ROMCU
MMVPSNLVYSTVCRISGFLYTIVGIASVISQAGLSYHRYVWLLKRNFCMKYFTRKQCICYVILIYVVTTIISCVYFLLGDYGKHAGLCFIAFQNIPLWHFMVLNLVPISICYSVNIFCAYKVYLFIRCHTNDRTRTIPSKIVEGRLIVNLIILETSIQLALELPVSLSIIAKLLGVEISDIVYAIVYCLFMLHTISDPLILMAILKPYRIYAVRLLARLITMGDQQETVTVVNPRQTTTL